MIGGHRKSWIALCLAYLAITAAAFGQDEADRVETPPLSYRRVYVPEADLTSQARGLLPMKRDEFLRRLASVGAKSESLSPAACRIETATYTAVLEEGQLVSGAAALQIACPADKSQWLSFGESNLAIGSAQWDEDPYRSAVLGLDPTGKTVVRTDRPSQLLLEWSARGQPTGRGGWKFDLILPPATRSELQISLPAGWTLAAKTGLVHHAGDTASADTSAASSPDEDESSRVTWALELGGLSRATFAVHPPADGWDDPLLLVSESGVYQLSPGNLDANLALTLNVHEQSVSELALRVAPPLNVLSVRYGDERLAWQEGAPDEVGIRRLILELPQPLPVGTHTLQIAATATWPMDETRAVPRIHVEGGLWQSGSCTLSSGADVRLSSRTLSGARQIGSTLPQAAGQPHSLQFEYFGAAAEVNFVATRPTAGLHVQSGLSIVLDSTQAAATLISDLSTSGDNRFEISSSASRRWIIESVETVPAELLEGRQITVLGPDMQHLAVQLRHPINDTQPVRLIVRARRQRSRDGQSLPSDFLRLLTYDDVHAERRLVSVASTEPSVESQFIGDLQIDRRDPAKATADELKLFESPPGPIFFETAATDAVGRLTLRRGEPRYSADVESRVSASRNALAHEIRIQLRPESSTISNLMVRASPKPTGEITWSIENDESQVIVAKPLDTEAGAGSDSDEALWRLQLQRPRSSAITLVGRWTQPFDKMSELPLFSLPEASSQTGAVQIVSTDGTSVRLRANEMFAAPLLGAKSGEISRTLGRFRYEPGRRASLILSADPHGQPALNLFVRQQIVRSTFSNDGSASHVAMLRLENLGADRLELAIPSTASIEHIMVDQSAATVARPPQASNRISIPLPANTRYPTVEVHYSSRGRPQSWWPAAEFTAPLPQVAVASLDRRWIVHMSPVLRCWPSGGAVSESLASSQRPFNLFAAADWRSLAGRLLVREDRFGASDSVGDAFSRGWHEYEFDLPEGTEGKLSVYRPAWIQVLGMAIAVAVFAVACAMPGSRSYIAMLIGLACILVLAVGATSRPIVPIVWWTVGGLIAGAVWRGLRAPRRGPRDATQPNSQPPGTTIVRSSHLIGAMLLVASIATALQAVSAAEGDSGKTTPATHRIVVPVDENQEPTGDYVYLSEEFYEAIHRLAESGLSSNASWLMRSASYDVSVSEDVSTLQPLGCEFVAEYEIETFADNVSVPLGLARTNLHLLESGSTLDGLSHAPAWNEDGTALIFDVPKSGRHRVEVRFAAAFQRQGDLYSALVTIPPITQSRVRVTCDADRGEAELSTGLGAVDTTSESGEVRANLGPVSELQIHYRLHPKTPEPLASVAVDQRLWWKVRPSSVIAHGRFEFTSSEGELREIVLKTDSRIKLLPLDSDAGIARQWTEEGETNTIHLALAPPYPAEASLHATFLYVGASGSGNLLPPAIDAVADRTVRNWQAVSVIPGWQVDGVEGELTPDAFAQAWGGTSETPQLAWDRTLLDSAPTLSIRPSADLPEATERIDYSVSRDTGHVQYEANIQRATASTFQFSVAAPPHLRIRRVHVMTGETELPSQWWRSKDGALSVAIGEAVSRSVSLKIEADWDIGRRSLIALPLLGLQSVQSQRCDVNVYRQSDVILTIESVAGFSAAEASLLGGHVHHLGRLAGRFEAEGDTPDRQLQIRLTPNAPKLTGEMITVVHQSDARWQAELHCALQVHNGVIDTLRFEIPEHWSGPFEIEPAVDHTIASIPGQARKQLVVRPQRAISDQLKLLIRAPLAVSVAETLRSPDIELLEAPDVVRHIALSDGGTGELTWETSGLQAITMASLSWPATLPVERFELFEVVAARSEAIARPTAEAVSHPSVRLADMQVSWKYDRSYFGTAHFHLHPAGLPDCILAAPPHCELASVTLDDGLADVQWISSRAVRVNLGYRQLPVQVKVAFRGRLPVSHNAGAQELNLQAPYLEGLPVVRTLWTIRAPHGVSHLPLTAHATPSTAANLNLERLHSAVAALGSASRSLPTALSSADVLDWSTYWNRYFEQTERNVDVRAIADPDERVRVSEQVGALQSQRATLMPGLETENLEIDPPPSPTEERSGEATVVYLLAEQALPSVAISYSAADAAGASRRMVSPGLLALAVLAVGVFLRRPAVSDWLQFNAWLLLALAGVAVWMLIPSGPVGWLMIGSAAVLAAFPRKWPSATLLSARVPYSD